eukprot:4727757-Pleurochrysis_carterae.AAC.3
MQSLPRAASGRGDYGRTSGECGLVYESCRRLRQASYFHTAARTVRVSGSEPFQSAAMRECVGKSQHPEKSYKCETKRESAATSIACET